MRNLFVKKNIILLQKRVACEIFLPKNLQSLENRFYKIAEFIS